MHANNMRVFYNNNIYLYALCVHVYLLMPPLDNEKECVYREKKK